MLFLHDLNVKLFKGDGQRLLRAFVVDDEPITADLIGRYLQDAGIVQVERIFYTPEGVIEEIDQLKPDIIFLDIEMPRITGIELANQIAFMQSQTKVVFVTAYSKYAHLVQQVNAVGYIMKPIDPQELERVILSVTKP